MRAPGPQVSCWRDDGRRRRRRQIDESDSGARLGRPGNGLRGRAQSRKRRRLRRFRDLRWRPSAEGDESGRAGSAGALRVEPEQRERSFQNSRTSGWPTLRRKFRLSGTITDRIEAILARRTADRRGRARRRRRATGSREKASTRERRLELPHWPGHRGRRRPDGGRARLVNHGENARRIGARPKAPNPSAKFRLAAPPV